MQQRMGMNLRLRSLRGGPVLRARGRGTGLRSRAHSTARQRALLHSHRGLRRIQTYTQSRKEIKVLSLSSNQK